MTEFISDGVGQVVFNIVCQVMSDVLVITGTFFGAGILITALAIKFCKKRG